MKKLILILILFSQTCLAQSISLESSTGIESCGLDRKSDLNQCEVDYFNSTLEKQRGDFDFKGKKVGFAYNTHGSKIITKKEYFDRWGKSYHDNGGRVINQLIILTASEKEKSGGLDAVIISWNKLGPLSKKQREKLISRIKKNNSV